MEIPILKNCNPHSTTRRNKNRTKATLLKTTPMQSLGHHPEGGCQHGRASLISVETTPTLCFRIPERLDSTQAVKLGHLDLCCTWRPDTWNPAMEAGLGKYSVRTEVPTTTLLKFTLAMVGTRMAPQNYQGEGNQKSETR